MKPGADSSAALVRADVLVLLRERRYEEALARLYQARTESPGSPELQRGIEQVKEFLVGAYAKRLGGLDQIARPTPPAAGRSPDVVLLSRYIDGVSSYADLAEICPLGRVRTLQVLVEMYASTPGAPAASGEPEEHSATRPLESLSQPQLALQGVEAADEAAPSTARSGFATPAPPAVDESPEAREYRDAFARGTAAFIQGRCADAIEAFEACARLRPGPATEVMLRRARRDSESRA